MMATNPVSTANVANHPIHPMLVPFPIAFLVGAFASDVAFWSTANSFWAQASMWLIGAALVMGALAAVAGLIDFLGEERIRALPAAWYHFLGNGTAVVLALVNFFLRYGQGAEAAVVPWGLLLSLIVVGILLFTGWKGWEMVYLHRVAVFDAPEQMTGDATKTSARDTHRRAA
jgi:uncharacterized membrane protein